jgi:hypothetical protein
MFINFRKSDMPNSAINTNQIVSFFCSIECVELKEEVPAFISVKKAEYQLLRVLWDEGGSESFVRMDKYGTYRTQKSGGQLLIGKTKRVRGTEEFDRRGVVLQEDVPSCLLNLLFAGAGNAVEGSSCLVRDFRFYSIEDFIKAIDAITGATGIQVVD